VAWPRIFTFPAVGLRRLSGSRGAGHHRHRLTPGHRVVVRRGVLHMEDGELRDASRALARLHEALQRAQTRVQFRKLQFFEACGTSSDDALPTLDEHTAKGWILGRRGDVAQRA